MNKCVFVLAGFVVVLAAMMSSVEANPEPEPNPDPEPWNSGSLSYNCGYSGSSCSSSYDCCSGLKCKFSSYGHSHYGTCTRRITFRRKYRPRRPVYKSYRRRNRHFSHRRGHGSHRPFYA